MNDPAHELPGIESFRIQFISQVPDLKDKIYNLHPGDKLTIQNPENVFVSEDQMMQYVSDLKNLVYPKLEITRTDTTLVIEWPDEIIPYIITPYIKVGEI